MGEQSTPAHENFSLLKLVINILRARALIKLVITCDPSSLVPTKNRYTMEFLILNPIIVV